MDDAVFFTSYFINLRNQKIQFILINGILLKYIMQLKFQNQLKIMIVTQVVIMLYALKYLILKFYLYNVF